MKQWLVIGMVLLTLGSVGCSKEKEKGGAPAKVAAEGELAPDFTARELSGSEVRLSSLRGKVVLVNFWATWCPPCREEIPSMVALNRQMAGKPFRMLALSIDDGGKGAVEEFCKKSGQGLPALLDTDQQVGKLYGITGVPETFVIDKKGVILKKVVGGLDWSAPEVVTYLDGLLRQ